MRRKSKTVDEILALGMGPATPVYRQSNTEPGPGSSIATLLNTPAPPGYSHIESIPMKLHPIWFLNQFLALRIYGDYFCEFNYHKAMKVRIFRYTSTFAPSLSITTYMFATDKPMEFAEFKEWIAQSFNYSIVL